MMVPRPLGHRRDRRCAFVLMILAISGAGCGRKGPPLPPLVRLPAPPDDFTAERRADEVKLRFTAPAANTDGSRPANVDRVEVYGFTGPFTANNEQLLKYGTRVATVTVRAPKDPQVTTGPEEPPEEPELKEEGIGQGTVVQLVEPITADAMTVVQLPADRDKRRRTADSSDRALPLGGPPAEVPWRIFVALGINTDGRKGPLSKRITVPLVPAPSPPTDPAVTYDERAIAVTWKPSPSWAPVQPPPAEADGLLPARFIGMDLPSITYHVYEISLLAEAGAASGAPGLRTSPEGEVRLTTNAVNPSGYQDTRMEWGKTRCYGVRALETISGQTLESEMSQPACVTLKDTFPPGAPKNLQHIASEGVVSLIWEPNAEADLAGYLVLRGTPPSTTLDPVTADPITATVFEDKVTSGKRFSYAIVAVDRAGNRSPTSPVVEETAR